MTLESSTNTHNPYKSSIVLQSSSSNYETSVGPNILFKGEFSPFSNDKFDIGNGIRRIKDLYISGNLTDGTDTNKISVANIASKSEIPTKTSQLTNDSSFITSTALTGYATEDWVEQKGYLTSVAWVDITDKPTLATVATSGSYNDLADKPTIPAAQVNSDWNASSGIAQILNKPTFATVATSGSYNDLSDKPTIPTTTSQLTNDSNFVTGEVLSWFAAKDWVEQKGYQTASDVSTAISNQTKETWTFTLSDGSTVTKSVVLGE